MSLKLHVPAAVRNTKMINSYILRDKGRAKRQLSLLLLRWLPWS
jgi:hypothetical protein